MPIDKKTFNNDKVCRMVYDKLIQGDDTIHDIVDKWNRTEKLDIDIDTIKNTLLAVSYLKVAKYASFQYRLLWRAIYLNDHLYYSNKSNTQQCYLCHNFKENYQHFYY